MNELVGKLDKINESLAFSREDRETWTCEALGRIISRRESVHPEEKCMPEKEVLWS